MRVRGVGMGVRVRGVGYGGEGEGEGVPSTAARNASRRMVRVRG